MELETERLRLLCLNARQLGLWLADLPALEKELSCAYCDEPLAGHFLEVVKAQRLIAQSDPDNDAWHSFFWMVRKADHAVVGSLDFKDAPNAAGEVEIGYGLAKAFEHNGYMTEAVMALCTWGLAQLRVRAIVAQTQPDGLASQRVLKRCGFQLDHQGETVWWRLQAARHA